jgi:flagellar motor switch protein FliN/FliY
VEAQFVSYAISAPALPEPLVLALGWGEPHEVRAAAPAPVGSRIDVILDIDLPVVVRYGHTELPIRALSRLGPGSVIDLGRSPDDPVEVLVSNRVVAHGEVVMVGGNYGVRILDVASQRERARSMEG